MTEDFEIAVSPPLFDECVRVISDIGKKRPGMVREWIDLLTSAVTFVQVNTRIDACRDPDDNKFLERAVDAEADFIVSGDDDLLSLIECGGISIISPALARQAAEFRFRATHNAPNPKLAFRPG